MARFVKNTESSFWGMVDIRGPDECWEWKGHRNKKGYTCYRWEGRRQGAHRVAFKFAKGDLPDDIKVCHTCDNPPCCNPRHLFAGTQTDNMQDCKQKGRLAKRRNRRKSSTFKSKLNGWQVVGAVARLLTGTENQLQLAEEFQVSPSTINMIWRGRTWTHLLTSEET